MQIAGYSNHHVKPDVKLEKVQVGERVRKFERGIVNEHGKKSPVGLDKQPCSCQNMATTSRCGETKITITERFWNVVLQCKQLQTIGVTTCN